MKKLIIKEIKNNENTITHIQIVEQTHRSKYFGDNSTCFEHDCFYLQSFTSPEIEYYDEDEEGDNILYVRGENKQGDNRTLEVPSYEWLEDMRSAVEAYNDYFNDDNPEDCKTCSSRHCNSCRED